MALMPGINADQFSRIHSAFVAALAEAKYEALPLVREIARELATMKRVTIFSYANVVAGLARTVRMSEALHVKVEDSDPRPVVFGSYQVNELRFRVGRPEFGKIEYVGGDIIVTFREINDKPFVQEISICSKSCAAGPRKRAVSRLVRKIIDGSILFYTE